MLGHPNGLVLAADREVDVVGVNTHVRAGAIGALLGKPSSASTCQVIGGGDRDVSGSFVGLPCFESCSCVCASATVAAGSLRVHLAEPGWRSGCVSGDRLAW